MLRDSLEMRVRVKDADGPVQIANLVYLIAHPSTLRRLTFASMEHLDMDTRRNMGCATRHGGYGRVGYVEEGRRGDIHVEGQPFPAYIPGAAREWVIQQLKQQGIIVEDDDDDK
jgi:hypothetical protein